MVQNLILIHYILREEWKLVTKALHFCMSTEKGEGECQEVMNFPEYWSLCWDLGVLPVIKPNYTPDAFNCHLLYASLVGHQSLELSQCTLLEFRSHISCLWVIPDPYWWAGSDPQEIPSQLTLNTSNHQVHIGSRNFCLKNANLLVEKNQSVRKSPVLQDEGRRLISRT